MRNGSLLKHPLLHVCVWTLLILFTNCSGFSPKDLASLQSASGTTSGSSGGSIIPTPAPTPLPAGTTKVFMASGNMGRTVMSCDDGKTWINNRSDNDAARCNVATTDPNYVECTHASGAAITADAGDGWFFNDYGWGAAGSVRRSRDGVNWQTMRSDSWGGGVFYALGQLWLLWDNWYLSGDGGSTWSVDANSQSVMQLDHPLGHRLGTKFMAVGRGNEIAMSYDQGKTWERPSSGFDPSWSTYGVAEGNGLIVAIGYSFAQTTGIFTLYSTRSTDGGHTWTSQVVDPKSPNGGWEQLFFDGRQFVALSFLATWKSPDGITWTSSPLKYDQAVNQWSQFGKIGFNPLTGTYVMISGSYSTQSVSRSTDAINWTIQSPSVITQSHPINAIAVGDMDSKYCP